MKKTRELILGRRPAMMKLSNERIQQILHQETPQKEELGTILRAIYIRYMNLFEKYLDDVDVDGLNDKKIAEMRQYHEETRSLTRYYYMDIPQDICLGIKEFESRFSDNLLGAEWQKYLQDSFKEFKKESHKNDCSEEYLKKQFVEQNRIDFYEAIGYVFRDGFGTDSRSAKNMADGISGLLFGKDE